MEAEEVGGAEVGGAEVGGAEAEEVGGAEAEEVGGAEVGGGQEQWGGDERNTYYNQMYDDFEFGEEEVEEASGEEEEEEEEEDMEEQAPNPLLQAVMTLEDLLGPYLLTEQAVITLPVMRMAVEQVAELKAPVRKAYLKWSLANHPDKGGDAEVFKRGDDAYKFWLKAMEGLPNL